MNFEKKKLHKLGNEDISYSQQNDYQMQKEKELENNIKTSQANGKKKNKFFLSLNKLIQDVNDDIKKNKNQNIDELKKSSELYRLYEQEISNKNDILGVFHQVKSNAISYFTKKFEKETIKDFRIVLERLEGDISNFKVILEINISLTLLKITSY